MLVVLRIRPRALASVGRALWMCVAPRCVCVCGGEGGGAARATHRCAGQLSPIDCSLQMQSPPLGKQTAALVEKLNDFWLQEGSRTCRRRFSFTRDIFIIYNRIIHSEIRTRRSSVIVPSPPRASQLSSQTQLSSPTAVTAQLFSFPVSEEVTANRMDQVSE